MERGESVDNGECKASGMSGLIWMKKDFANFMVQKIYDTVYNLKHQLGFQ